jgi:hypothetical protein
VEDLDGDLLAHVHVLGRIDLAHASFPEQRVDSVAFGDDGPRLKGRELRIRGL